MINIVSKSRIIGDILTFLLLWNFLSAVEIDMIEEKPDRLRLQIKTDQKLFFKGLQKYPEEPIRLNFQDRFGEFFTENLYIPIYTRMIALPSAKKPEIRITNLSTQPVEIPKNFPSALLDKFNNMEKITFTKPGFSRHIPATNMKITPLQYNKQNGQLQIITSMTVELSFQENRNLSIDKNVNRSIMATGFLNKKYVDQYYQEPQRKFSKTTYYPDGKWIRIAIQQSGIYKIGYESIREQIGIDGTISIQRLALFSNSNFGRRMSTNLSAETPPNLVENSIQILGGNDQEFGTEDTILFYGQATSGFDLNSYGNYDYNKNPYSDINYYWLVVADQELSSPKRMQELDAENIAPDYTQTTSETRYRYERDLYNFMQSGDDWFGKKFDSEGDAKTIVLSLDNINNSANQELGQDRNLKIDVRLAGAKDESRNNFAIYFNSQQVETASLSSYSRRTLDLSENLLQNYLDPDGSNIVRISYRTNNSKAYFDYLEAKYHQNLIYDNDPFLLTADKFSGNIKYELTNNSSQNLAIYEIDDLSAPALQKYDQEDDKLVFTAPNLSNERRQYYICTPQDYREPKEITYINDTEWNQLRDPNLQADYIIITRPRFQQAAQRIADIHENQVKTEDQLETIITYQDQIMREFNGDVRDPGAIRFFIKYAFDNWTTAPSYLLLLGDGSYDHRGIEQEFTASNQTMTYQDSGAPGEYYYFPNDAFYSYIKGSDNIMDLAVGRINVQTSEQAQVVADKIENYITDPEYGEWRNQVTLVADDPNRPYSNETEHIKDSENSLAANFPPFFNLSKLYALEFPAEENASSYGIGRPEATQAIIEQLNKGTSIITYLGHGSPDHWAQEGLLETNDLGKIATGKKLPIWLVGTCSWSYYDFLDKLCIPERLILSENSGAIAAFGGPRPSFATSNASLLRKILQEWLDEDRNNRIRIGEIIRRIKNGASNNDEQYTLLGDPAVYPAVPYYRADFDRTENDTLQALERVQVSGKIEDQLSNFSGQAILKVFDSEEKVNRKDTEGNTLSYIIPGNKIFNGQFSIKDGQFSSNFIVPKDISFGSRPGYYNLYAWNSETGKEIAGYFNKVYYYGSEEVQDTTGPSIDIGFSGLDFRESDIITPENDLMIELQDANGINIANQLGHEMRLKFDGGDRVFNVNEYFTATSDTTGQVNFSLPGDLEPGIHEITFQAWDNANNINIEKSEFNFTSSTQLELKQVVNYPNPFASNTDFTFQLTADARIKIKIYTIRGLLIKELNPNQVFPAGFNTVPWNGRDDFGDKISRGIYLYKITARSSLFDEKDNYIGKIVKE